MCNEHLIFENNIDGLEFLKVMILINLSLETFKQVF